MSEELQKLRREIRADFEMMSARQSDMAARLDRQGHTFSEALAQMGVQMNEVAQQMSGLSLNVKKLYAELSETTRWTEGRLRLTNERFDGVLGAVEGELQSHRTLAEQKFEALERRVEALEKDRDAAA